MPSLTRANPLTPTGAGTLVPQQPGTSEGKARPVEQAGGNLDSVRRPASDDAHGRRGEAARAAHRPRSRPCSPRPRRHAAAKVQADRRARLARAGRSRVTVKGSTKKTKVALTLSKDAKADKRDVKLAKLKAQAKGKFAGKVTIKATPRPLLQLLACVGKACIGEGDQGHAPRPPRQPAAGADRSCERPDLASRPGQREPAARPDRHADARPGQPGPDADPGPRRTRRTPRPELDPGAATSVYDADEVPLLRRQPDPARRRARRDQRQAGRRPARHRPGPRRQADRGRARDRARPPRARLDQHPRGRQVRPRRQRRRRHAAVRGRRLPDGPAHARRRTGRTTRRSTTS